MKRFTTSELAGKSENELSAIFSKAAQKLAAAQPFSTESVEAFETMEGAQREIAARQAKPKP